MRPEDMDEKLRRAGKRASYEEEAAQEEHGRNILFPIQSFRAFGSGGGRRYLIKGLIPASGLVLVWGPPKTAKSFVMLDMAMSIARGLEYRGHRVRKGSIVYLALEGEAGFQARRDAYATRFMAEHEDPAFYLMTTQIDLRRQVNALCDDIRAQLGATTTISMVVVDTLNRSLFGSESKDEDMAGYIRAADLIREDFNCTVLIIHHCGINGERPRGHTSLTGAVDAQLAVRKDEDGTIALLVEHMKDGAFGEVISSRLEIVELGVDEDGDRITSCVVVPVDEPASANKREAGLGKAAKRALNSLYEAIVDSGEIPPPNAHIPDNTRVVTVERWEAVANQRGISKSDFGDSRRKAFNRAAETLAERGLIGIWQPYAWPTRERPS